jgi:hypothetical protein
MEPLSYIPNNIPQLPITDFIIQEQSLSAISCWKIYCNCHRLKDNKQFSAVVVPNKDYMAAMLLFLDQIHPFNQAAFIRPIGFIYEQDLTQEFSVAHQIIIFEEFKCPLSSYVTDYELTKQEFEDLGNLMIDTTRFLTRDLGGIFPRFSPDCVVVKKPAKGKVVFKLMDFIFSENVAFQFPFEDTKWFAPEIYKSYHSDSLSSSLLKKNMIDPKNDHNKAFLFSVGLVLLFTCTKSNFQEKRKTTKCVADLDKIWPQEQ